MKRRIVLIAIIVIGSMALSGCMMMGGHDSHQAQDAEESERIVKEVILGDYRIVAEFPPLLEGQESLLLLHVHSSDSSRSIAAIARIIISREEVQEGVENILIQEVLTPSEDGMYAYSFTPGEAGPFHLTFLVEQLGDLPLKKPLILSATQEVRAMSENEMDKSDHGSFSMTPLFIVGGAVMAAMMLLMFGARHF